MKFLLIAALLLSGCGLVPDPFEFLESTTNCLGPYYVKNGVGTLDYDKLHANEMTLKHLMIDGWDFQSYDETTQTWSEVKHHGGVFGGTREFCDSFGDLHIEFTWAETFPCQGSPTGQCFGYDGVGNITLNYDGRSLAHELMHVWEFQHFIWDTSSHPHWQEKGYYWLNDDLYDTQQLPPMTGPNGEPYP